MLSQFDLALTLDLQAHNTMSQFRYYNHYATLVVHEHKPVLTCTCLQLEGNLHEAIKKGDLQCVQRLLAAGASANEEDQEVWLAF